MSKLSRTIALILVLVMMTAVFVGCTSTSEDAPEKTEKPEKKETTETKTETEPEPMGDSDAELIEFTMYYPGAQGIETSNMDDDLFAQWMTDKFQLKLKEVLYLEGMTGKQRLSLFLAAGDMPDVTFSINDISTYSSTGLFEDIGDLVQENCPNLMSYYPVEEWGPALYNGKLYGFPRLSMDANTPGFEDDPYQWYFGNWGRIIMREDIMAQAGYSFTPMDELYETYKTCDPKLTLDNFKTEPAIDTPDDLIKYFEAVKALGLEVNGAPVYAFNLPLWLEPHVGYMFGLAGNWKFNPDSGEVTQFLMDPNAKAYWQWFNEAYTKGLIDPDFATRSNDQIVELVDSGRAAAWMWTPNTTTTQEALWDYIGDEADVRAIAMPVASNVTAVGIDPVLKSTFQFYINSDFEDIPRMLRMWDFGLTKEATEFMSWGPEDLGLWSEDDGTRKWNDDVYEYFATSDTDWLNANYNKHGLGGKSTLSAYAIPFGISGIDLGTWNTSYPIDWSRTVFMDKGIGMLSNTSVDYKGYLMGGIDEDANAGVSFTYGEFEQQYSPKLFAAKTSDEFDAAWDEILKDYNERYDYATQQAKMEVAFMGRGFDVVRAEN